MAYFTSVLSTTLVLFVLGVLGTLTISGHKLAGYVREKLKLQVVMNFGTEDADVQSVQQWLNEAAFVKSTELITAEQALEGFEFLYNEDPMEVLDENPLPPSIEVTLKPEYANSDSIRMIETSILVAHEGAVYQVHKDQNMIDDVNSNITSIRYSLLAVFIVLTIVMVALINNTIRLAIYSKRFLIKTMQLVGATGRFIRRPFLQAGLLQGMIAGIIAIAGLSAFSWWMVRQFPDEVFSVDDYALFGAVFLLVMLAGLLISYVSTSLAVRKFLRLKMDALY